MSSSRLPRMARVALLLCCALSPVLADAQGSRHVEVRLDAAAAQPHAAGRLLVFAIPAAQAESAAKDGKTGQSARVGEELAKKALSAGVKQAGFDKGSYKYHGRIKAVADGARKGGLKI